MHWGEHVRIMADDEKKTETLTPFAVEVGSEGDRGLALHEDGNTIDIVPYIVPADGKPLNGHPIFVNRRDGSFERLDLGHSTKGPAQVATEAYRTSWERTFGSRGGVS